MTLIELLSQLSNMERELQRVELSPNLLVEHEIVFPLLDEHILSTVVDLRQDVLKRQCLQLLTV